MARKVLMAEVSGGQVSGRPRLGLMDTEALGSRSVKSVYSERQCEDGVESPGAYVDD